ncbi:MAG: SNF2-related protein [Myxococcota bacterium]
MIEARSPIVATPDSVRGDRSSGPTPIRTAQPTAATPESWFTRRLFAEELTLRRPADHPARIARALRRAAIDLNPHQVEAAVEGLRALKDRGLVLADEVGLGKTIEAGLVLAQLVAEGKGRLLVLTPASLRRQWARELEEKLGISSTVVDGNTEAKDRRAGRSFSNVFDRGPEIIIASHPFAARRAAEIEAVRWDAVIIDEAHRLRGAHKGSKTAQALRAALHRRPKLLLTATPMQNGLGELYGLMSFLDPELLGSFEQFRRAFPETLEGSTAQGLRARVKPFVHRTLRRQVREYVRYTERRSIACEFNPSAAEDRLYTEVSEYLANPETLAIDPARRHLMVLVYRKLLASSPFAIAGTLETLARGLRERLERGDVEEEAPDADALELLRQLEDEELPEGEPKKKERPPATKGRIDAEIAVLDELAALARSIRRPAKTEALLMALDRAFTEAAGRGWPQKAVIFTESRRTQDALKEALEAAGHQGQVQLLHGASGDADARAAIVDAFRSQARILILTEAGAEGLNLQFCNLVVNYDLPWNPQRIEQRIGRCHRYGQTRDVVVLNFLAAENEAEARLYEILSDKLALFDGVFGATDEPLGAIGDGAAFERRVNDIFTSCRSESEIRAAFDALQTELSDAIADKMNDAKAAIVDHFDDEIRARLRMTGAEAAAVLDADEQRLVRLVVSGVEGATLDGDGRIHMDGAIPIETARKNRTRDGDFLTLEHPVAARLIRDLRADEGKDQEARYTLFAYSEGGHKISRLAPLVGGEGWWLVYRVSFEGPISEDHLVHVVLMRDPSGETVVLDPQQISALEGVTSRDAPRRPRLKAATLASTHGEAVLAPEIDALLRGAEERARTELRRQREMIELSFEDRLRAAADLTHAAQEGWRTARAEGLDDVAEKSLRELTKAMDREGEERTAAVRWRKERMAELESKVGLSRAHTLIASTYFWLE